MPGFFEQLAQESPSNIENRDNLSSSSGGFFENLSSQTQPTPTGKEEALRHGVRSLSRAGETLAGLPGDIASLLGSGIAYGAEKIAKRPLPELREAIEKGPISIEGDEFIPATMPTSQQLRESIAQLSKGYTEPQNEAEKIADELVSDITAFSLPIKGRIPFLRAIGTAIAGGGAKQLAKGLGAEEKGQEFTKLGAIFFSGLMGRPNARSYVSSLYDKSRESIPKGTMLDTSSLTKGLTNLENDLKKGVSTTTKKQVLANVKELKNKSSGGALPIDELLQSYQDINETISSRKLFDELSKTEQKLLRRRFDLLKNEIGKSLEDYGKNNPEFIENWRAANESFATLQKSQKVSKTISKALKAKQSLMASPAIILFEALNPSTLPPTLAGAAGAYGAVKSGELLYRISKSPNLRKHYLDVIRNSMEDNVPGVVKSLSRLDQELSPKED